MGDDFWQTTAQMFGSLFEKPKMSEKLLLKPPFKYLFDIITQTFKSTGFGEKLYTDEEQSADYYDTKEKKIYFLQKVIALVGLMLKEDIECKPNKVVAGIEPDKTNLFLQAMYRAAVSGEDSGPYVKKVNAKFVNQAEGGGGEEEKPKEEPKQEKPKEKPKKEEPKKEEPKQEKPKPKEEAKQEKPKPKEEPKKESKAQEKPKAEPEKPPAKLERPQSGRRMPKDTSNVQVVDDRGANKKGTANIITDDARKEEEDMFEENKPKQGAAIGKSAGGAHSKIVKSGMKELEKEDKPAEEKESGGGGVRMGKIGSKRAKDTAGGDTGAQRGAAESGEPIAPGAGGSSANEVEATQKLIQAVTQNINPLRKSIDFINDDIESMNKEMEYWRSQYLGSKAKYQLELAQTEEQLQPLQNKLAELEEQIKDRKFKIQGMRSSTLQNEQRIQKLLHAVVSSK